MQSARSSFGAVARPVIDAKSLRRSGEVAFSHHSTPHGRRELDSNQRARAVIAARSMTPPPEGCSQAGLATTDRIAMVVHVAGVVRLCCPKQNARGRLFFLRVASHPQKRRKEVHHESWSNHDYRLCREHPFQRAGPRRPPRRTAHTCDEPPRQPGAHRVLAGGARARNGPCLHRARPSRAPGGASVHRRLGRTKSRDGWALGTSER